MSNRRYHQDAVRNAAHAGAVHATTLTRAVEYPSEFLADPDFDILLEVDGVDAHNREEVDAYLAGFYLARLTPSGRATVEYAAWEVAS